jgi:hypothetical protein
MSEEAWYYTLHSGKTLERIILDENYKTTIEFWSDENAEASAIRRQKLSSIKV